MIPIAKPVLEEAEAEAARQAVLSGWVTQGPQVAAFESEFAAHVDAPIHGTRIIRLPGGRFVGEITEEIPPARDAEGKIDVQGTMQAITGVVDGWIREHPEQWREIQQRAEEKRARKELGEKRLRTTGSDGKR